MCKTVHFARNNRISVVYSLYENDAFLKRGNTEDLVINGLEPLADDIVIRKRQPDIFACTRLEEMLGERNISSLMIEDVIYNGCARQACLSAL